MLVIFKYRFVNLSPEIAENFKCSICLDIFEAPLELLCGHIFCSECIKGCLDTGNICECPECRQRINYGEVRPPNKKLLNLLRNFEIKCEYTNVGCCVVVKLENLVDHTRKCNFRGLLTPSAPYDEPDNEDRQYMATSLVNDTFDVLIQRIVDRNEPSRNREQLFELRQSSVCSRCFDSTVRIYTSLRDWINYDPDRRLLCKFVVIIIFAILLMILMALAPHNLTKAKINQIIR